MEVTRNKKAYFEYQILEKFESGIVLTGTEIKSCRNKEVRLDESYITIENNSAYLVNCHIANYKHGNQFNHETLRKRPLLLHKREILKLNKAVQQKGLTIIVLKMYINNRGLLKVSIALAQGKKLVDKRKTIQNREEKIAIKRLLKNKQN